MENRRVFPGRNGPRNPSRNRHDAHTWSELDAGNPSGTLQRNNTRVTGRHFISKVAPLACDE